MENLEVQGDEKLKWNLDYEFSGEQHSRTRFIIYKIENTISKNVYIGQTRRELKERWADYKRDLLKPVHIDKRSGSNIKLKRSVQKHYKKEGNLDFLKFSIVEVVDVSSLASDDEKRLRLDQREQELIKEYRKLHGGRKVCNVLDGGRTHVFTEEDRKTMSESQKAFYESEAGKRRINRLKEENAGEGNPMYGKKQSEESNRKNSESNIGKQAGENNAMYGRHHSEEAKNKVSQANKGRPSKRKGTSCSKIAGMKNPSAKIYDLSLNPLISPTGEQFLRIECLEDFCRAHSLLSCKMSEVLRSKRPSHKGWRLSYVISAT
jgi:group I intron endonuclease